MRWKIISCHFYLALTSWTYPFPLQHVTYAVVYTVYSLVLTRSSFNLTNKGAPGDPPSPVEHSPAIQPIIWSVHFPVFVTSVPICSPVRLAQLLKGVRVPPELHQDKYVNECHPICIKNSLENFTNCRHFQDMGNLS